VSGIKHENIIQLNNMTKKYYVHILEGKPPSEWQPLEEHLKSVAKMASSIYYGFWCKGLGLELSGRVVT
jgi:hypothetical protein